MARYVIFGFRLKWPWHDFIDIRVNCYKHLSFCVSSPLPRNLVCWTVICLIHKASFNTFYKVWFLTPGSNLLFMTTLKRAKSETYLSNRFQVTGNDRHKPKKIYRPTQNFNMSHCATCFVSHEPSSWQTVVLLRADSSSFWDRESLLR